MKIANINCLNGHILWSSRRIQSQKPDMVYNILEDSISSSLSGKKIELCGRSLNLRSGWQTVGLQVLPEEQDCWIYLTKDT